MYFIQPSRQIPSLEQVLDALPSLKMISLEDIQHSDPTIIAIADVHDFLQHQWSLPTIVIAHENEGDALSQAWEIGALAGWIWTHLPRDLESSLLKIDAQYKRNQDSRDLPSAVELQKKLLPNPIELKTIQSKHCFNLLPIFLVIGMIIGKLAIKKSFSI